MRRILLVILLVLVVAVVAGVVRTLEVGGTFASLEPVSGDCAPLEAPKGPEDIVADRAAGFLFISSTDRRAIIAGNEQVRGDIYIMRLNAPQEGAIPLTTGFGDAPSDFRPHGLSLYDDGQGNKTLMVVNHPASGNHTVEIFNVISDSFGSVKLKHRRTISHPLFVAPNDLAAVDHERFYVTNDHGNPPGFRREIENYLVLPEANIVYWDGSHMSVAADGLAIANGIALSPDGGSVYAAETTGRSVRIYSRNPSNGALSLRETIFLGSGLDNIDVDPGGNIWVAAHPKLFALLAHGENSETLSPSQVIRIPRGPRGFGEPTTVFLDLGENLSGGSTAVADRDTIYISNIYEPKMLVCRVS